MSTVAQRLARHALRLAGTSDPALFAKAQICLLDYLASALAGVHAPTAAISASVATGFGPGPCTRLGMSETASAACAALHNGLIGHAEEMDDSHRYVSGLHLATVILPALLAAAEESGASGREIASAMAGGYEAAGRLCRCLDKGLRARGFHSTGVIAPFGAAAAVVLLLHGDEDSLVNAFGLAASSAAGLFAFLENGASVKHYHAGRAALDGYLAARLALAGLTGPPSVFEGREGFFRAYSAETLMDALEAPTEGPELACVYHKLHSACGHAFPAIDTALALRQVLLKETPDAPLHPDRFIALDYASYHAAAVLDRPDPQTMAQARFSVPFMLSMALLMGRTSRHDFDEALSRADIRELCGRIDLREDPQLAEAFPRLRAGVLRATLADGRVLEFRVDAPRGMPEYPVSFEDIAVKFRAEAEPLWGSRHAEAIIKEVRNLEHLPSIHNLMALLRSA